MYIPHDPSRYKGRNGVSPLQSAAVGWHEAREMVRGESKLGRKKMKFVRNLNSKFTDPNVQQQMIAAASNPNVQQQMQNLSTIMPAFIHYPGVLSDEAKLAGRLKRRHGLDFQSDIAYGFSRNPEEKKVSAMSPKKGYQYTRDKILDGYRTLGMDISDIEG